MILEIMIREIMLLEILILEKMLLFFRKYIIAEKVDLCLAI